MPTIHLATRIDYATLPIARRADGCPGAYLCLPGMSICGGYLRISVLVFRAYITLATSAAQDSAEMLFYCF